MIKRLLKKAQSNVDAPFAKRLDSAPVHEKIAMEAPSPKKKEEDKVEESVVSVEEKTDEKKSVKRAHLPQQAPSNFFSLDDLKTPETVTFCPGCGDWGIMMALKNALVKLNIPQEQVVIVCGIGCHGHMANFINTYNFEGLHGRPIPVAEGVKVANDKLKVIVLAGDGDTYGEGLNHFMMGLRSNHDVTLLVHDNRIYGLTTGQTSPTCEKGFVSKSTPYGSIETPLNPMAVAIANHGTFVARSFCGNLPHMTDMMVQAMEHDGFSVVDILQNCHSFNHVNTVQWFKEHSYVLEGHDPSNKLKAMEIALDEEKLALGLIYKNNRESYQDASPELKDTPLVRHPTHNVDLTETFEKYC